MMTFKILDSNFHFRCTFKLHASVQRLIETQAQFRSIEKERHEIKSLKFVFYYTKYRKFVAIVHAQRCIKCFAYNFFRNHSKSVYIVTEIDRESPSVINEDNSNTCQLF